jgi:lipoate-protein ligase A
MIVVGELKILPFGRHNASHNMSLDSRLLELCENDPGCGFLRLYQWDPPALSIGFFDPADAVDSDRAVRQGIDVVRRPTGGRVVLHKGDLTYSVVVPRSAGSVAAVYGAISERIAEGLRSLGASVDISRGAPARSVGRGRPCFLSASRHEIVHGGRKMVGSAQRAGRRALLQHGSIPIDRGYLEVVDYMRCSEERKAALRQDMLTATACIDDVLGFPGDPGAVAAAIALAFGTGFAAVVTDVSPGDCLALNPGGPVGLTP